MKTDVPLVVPEINGDQAIEAYRSGQKLFAGPNCSTVQLVMALAPLHAAYGIRRVVASTYQSVSGAGREAVSEFFGQIAQGVDAYPPRHLAHPIAQNLIPQIGKFGSDGFSSEETKIMQESRKILGLPDLRIVATAVRVPTEVVHCESVAIEFDRACTIEGVRQALSDFPGIAVQDDPALGIYPMNLTSRDQDLVAVGRIRRDPSVDSGVTLWIASDNLRKGAALNAIQIAELLISQGSG
jgi:aspartate-semialdehyde dehydrogenase